MMRFIICLVTLLAFVIAQDNTGLNYELNILHFNDFHARFDEISPQGTVCDPDQAPCIGGFARLFTAIRLSLEAEPQSILLNAGDTFQGTIWYNFMRWNVSQHFMNLLPHDAHVLGNHEFDHGIEGLIPYLERLSAPMLGANVNTTFEPELGQYVRNHVVLNRRGRRIGVIGVLLRDFTVPGRLIIEDEVEAVNREAAILTEQGVDIIVVLSHLGFNPDLDMARRISRHVDIIVGAHSHTLLYTGTPPSGDSPTSQYPTVVERDDGHRILVVQASCYTLYLGNIKLFIDDDGFIQSWEGQPIFLGSSIVPDPQMVEQLVPWREEVDAIGKEVVGSTKVALEQSSCYSRECNMGNWACDAFLEEVIPLANGSLWNYAHACLIGAGGLRVQISPGSVTTESLMMAMPFENHMVAYDLRGQFLLEALELSVSADFTTPDDFSSFRMTQIGGMRVVYNLSMPIGSRVRSASVRCIDCNVPQYHTLDSNAIYRLLTPDFTANGGDGFTMLSENRFNVVTLEVDYVMMQNYMRRQGPVITDLDGRIQIVF